MQDFDSILEKMVRDGVVDLDTGLAYASNPGNLRLALSDFAEQAGAPAAKKEKEAPKPAAQKSGDTDLEIERF